MVRPKKWRYLSPLVRRQYFRPQGISLAELEEAALCGDELEAMRLCDREALEQAAAGRRMGVSRPTVQRLLYSGRRKLVDALIEGKAIRVVFPDYVTIKKERR